MNLGLKAFSPHFQNNITTLLRICSIRHSSYLQTVEVKQNIEHKRESALLGGGQKRIDAQHKKV